MIKKALDVTSLASIALAVGVVLSFTIWGESPRAPGHLSIESKILVWDCAPFAFGFLWLLARYANAAAERFPRVFGLLFGRRGLLFYFACFLGVIIFLENFLELSAWLNR